MKSLPYILLTLSLSHIEAQTINFHKEYDVRTFDIHSLTETRDTFYYAAGQHCSVPQGPCINFLGFITKFNDCGDTIWHRTYLPLSNQTAGFSIDAIRELPQGGLIAVAGEGTNNPALGWWYILRLDISGNLLSFIQMSPLNGNEWASYIEVLGPNRFVISGITSNNISFTNGESFVCMTDSMGNVLWSNRWFEPNNPGGSYMLGLESDSAQMRIFLTYFQNQSQKTHLVRLDTSGNAVFDKPFNGYWESLGIRPDGKPVTSGRYFPGLYTHLHDPLTGDTLWKRRISPAYSNSWDQRVCGLNNNEVATAFTMPYMANGTWAVDRKDTAGNFLYQADTFDVLEKRMDAITPTFTGGFVMAGHRWDSSGSPGILILMKMDDANCNPNGIQETESNAQFQIYPNPATDHLYISASTFEKFNVTVSDMTGRIVLTSVDCKNGSSIDISTLEPGVWILQIEGRFAARFIKM